MPFPREKNASIKIIDDTGLLREHTHVGSVLDYEFRVVFVVREEKEVCNIM